MTDRFRFADNVFTAIVTGEYLEPTDERTPVRSQFTITETFKGAQPFGALVSQPDDNMCGIDLDVGEEHLIFAPNSGQIGLCSGIRPTALVAEELAAL